MKGIRSGKIRTNSVWGVFPHFADQLRHGIPILVATGIVELLDVMRGFDCVRLGFVRTRSAESSTKRAKGEVAKEILGDTMLPRWKANPHYEYLIPQDMRTKHN